MKKSLQIQSSYDSALLLSFHCTSLSIIFLSQPRPAHLSPKGTSNCLTPDATRCPLERGKALQPGGIWKHIPHSNWGLEIAPRPAFFPVGTSLCKNKTMVTWPLDVIVL